MLCGFLFTPENMCGNCCFLGDCFWLVLFHQQVVVGPGSILNESRCLMKARPMPKRLWGWKQSADTVLGRRTWLIVKALAPQGFDT